PRPSSCRCGCRPWVECRKTLVPCDPLHSFSYRINIPQPGAFRHPARRKSAGGGESSSGPRPARHLHTFSGVIGLALIAILSDFGQTEYVGILRGVIQDRKSTRLNSS